MSETLVWAHKSLRETYVFAHRSPMSELTHVFRRRFSNLGEQFLVNPVEISPPVTRVCVEKKNAPRGAVSLRLSFALLYLRPLETKRLERQPGAQGAAPRLSWSISFRRIFSSLSDMEVVDCFFSSSAMRFSMSSAEVYLRSARSDLL